MRFSLIALGATAVTAQVSTLISELNSIKTQTQSLTAALQKYPGGVAAGVPILKAASKLKSATQAAIKAAQNSGTVSESDQAMVLQAVESLYPDIISSLDANVADAPKFSKAGLSSTAASTLKQLAGLSNQLSSVLVSKATGSFKSAAQQIAQDVSSAFSSAEAGKAPQAATLPKIPSSSGGSSSSASSKAPSSSTKAPSSSSSKAASKPSSAAASTTAVATPSPTPSSTPVASSAPAPEPSSSAPAPAYTGAAGKLVSNVGGAVLLAAAAFAL